MSGFLEASCASAIATVRRDIDSSRDTLHYGSKYGFCRKGGIFDERRAEQGNEVVAVVPQIKVVDDRFELVSK